MLIAVTRPVSPTLADCELTHLARQPIDVLRAAAQHEGYERLLGSLGAKVVRAAAAPELPDAVFVEDAALVLDEVAVLTRPGAPSRLAEVPGVATVLSRYRPIVTLVAPATLDGGDVLRLGRTLYVGRSGRSNPEGVEQLKSLLAPFDYEVVPLAFEGCLHLKSAVTALSDDVLLLNPAWLSAAGFGSRDCLSIDRREPHAANTLRIADTLVFPTHHPRTHELLVQRGFRVAAIDCSELAKAEGAVTCCSLIFEAAGERND